ncbi:MAG: GNAT family N-acetyltransferase [Vicinamibacterales bacterium]|nr:GNAT family N-acetyltransferase [Vicinamibacterales bacterium]
MKDLIQTTRLDLISMTPEFFEASLAGDRARQEALLEVEIPSDWPGHPQLMRRRLDALRAEPDLQPWLERAMVLRSECRMIGHTGFHARPAGIRTDPLLPASVEFGYVVFEKDRRQGYAREACSALMEWAYRQHGVTRFVVSISPANMASLALARGLGFERIGCHIDEEDGLEDILERRILAGQEFPLPR